LANKLFPDQTTALLLLGHLSGLLDKHGPNNTRQPKKEDLSKQGTLGEKEKGSQHPSLFNERKLKRNAINSVTLNRSLGTHGNTFLNMVPSKSSVSTTPG